MVFLLELFKTKKSYSIEKCNKSNNNNNQPQSCQFFGSVRMTFMICAFFAQIFHTWLRNTMNFLILCMVKKEANVLISNVTQVVSSQSNDICSIAKHEQASTFSYKSGDLEWTREEEFLMLSSLYYGYFLVMPIGGFLCNRFGGKIFFVHGLTIQAMLFIITPPILRWNYQAGFVLRVVQGIISGLGTPSIYQLFSVWSHPSEMTAVMSFAFGGFAIGTILAYPISGQLCYLGWEVAFYAVGSIILFMSCSFHYLVYNSLEEHPRLSEHEHAYLQKSSTNKMSSTIPWKHILKSVPIHAFNLTHIFHSYGLIVITIILPKMLRDTMAFSVTETSFYSIFPFFGSIVSKLFTIFLAPIERKFQKNLTAFKRTVYVTCNILTIGCLAGVVYSTCALKYLVVCLIFLFGFITDIAFSATYWPSLILVAPSYSGFIIGIANCFANFTGVISPAITAAIVKEGTKSEWNVVLYTIIGSYCISAFVYGCFGSTKTTSWGKITVENSNEKVKTKNFIDKSSMASVL